MSPARGDRMSEEKKTPGLEENFQKLEGIIEHLEDENLSLEDAFAAYSQGMALLKECNVQIDRVEKQVLKLTESGQLEEFQHDSGTL